MAQQSDWKLGDLLSKQNYFYLNEQYPLLKKQASKPYQLLTEAYLNCFFNNPTASNENIRELMSKYYNWLPISYQLPLALMAAENEMSVQNYNKAASVYTQIIEQCRPYYDSISLAWLINSHKICASLVDVPPMEVIYNQKHAKIPLIRDTWSLLKFPVYTYNEKKRTDTLYFMWDLGTNFSAMEERYMEFLKVKILSDSILISDPYGNYKYGKIGVVDELDLGEIQIKNIVFVIIPGRFTEHYPDDEMYAIFGLYAMKMLENMQITKSTLLISPSPKQFKKTQNMLLSNGSIFVNTKTTKTSLCMHFDSGRNISILTNNYLSKTGDTTNLIIDSVFVEDRKEMRKTIMIQKTNFTCQISNKKLSFPLIHIETQDYLPNYSILSDGVLGTDVILNNKKLTIDFKNMYFKVR
jgi:hypothetical protein